MLHNLSGAITNNPHFLHLFREINKLLFSAR